MRRSVAIPLLLALGSPLPAAAQYANTADCLNPEEASLLALVNQYRQQNGLPAVATSFSLSSVGQWHVWDLETNNPWAGSCNLHSWSNARPAIWEPVCYTSDHAQASGMWNKPRQITGNAYNSNGYENSAWTSGTMTAPAALQMWQNSPSHNQVILNQSDWSQLTWRAMGVGVSQHYAVLWFGTLTDPLGTMSPCGSTPPGELFADGFES